MKNKSALIKISPELKKFIDSMKINSSDSYNDVLWNFLEPYMERSKESLGRSRLADKEYKEGKVKTIDEVFNMNEFDKEIFGKDSR